MFHHIYLGDSEQVLKTLAGGSVSLVFTSPPYFLMRGYVDYPSYEVYLDKMYRILSECKRVLAYGRHMIINICDYIVEGEKYPIPSDIIQMCTKALGFKYCDDIIWVKPEGMASSASMRCGMFVKEGFPLYYKPNNIYEHIIVFRKGKIDDYSKFKRPQFIYENVVARFIDYFCDVWRINPVTNIEQDHPAKFPETLPKLIIQFYTMPSEDEVVLDPFLGSGTSMKVAFQLGRSSIGVELEDKYLPVIKAKVGFGQKQLISKQVQNLVIKRETGQLDLFKSLSNKEETIESTEVISSKDVDWRIIDERIKETHT